MRWLNPFKFRKLLEDSSPEIPELERNDRSFETHPPEAVQTLDPIKSDSAVIEREETYPVSRGFIQSFRDLFIKAKPKEEVLDELEELLIRADFGPNLSKSFINTIRNQRFTPETMNTTVRDSLTSEIEHMFEAQEPDHLIHAFANCLHVIVVCGVNGSGKTTTIAKLAYRFQLHHKTVMVAACDTFRAAAVEQLEVWTKRLNIPLYKRSDKKDPASIAYDACKEAMQQHIDVLIIDTSGRLHNHESLMDELKKLVHVLKKIDPSFPQSRILILDGTTGQNSVEQAKAFSKTVDANGIIMTKLDGTAKGGTLAAVYHSCKIPILYVGYGERSLDLKPFNPISYAHSMFE